MNKGGNEKIQQIGWKFWGFLRIQSDYFLLPQKCWGTSLCVLKHSFVYVLKHNLMIFWTKEETKRFGKSAEHFGGCYANILIIFYYLIFFFNFRLGLNTQFYDSLNKGGNKKVLQIGWIFWWLLRIHMVIIFYYLKNFKQLPYRYKNTILCIFENTFLCFFERRRKQKGSANRLKILVVVTRTE